jgi:hypothetical protein
MSVAAFMDFSYTFMPFIITVSAIAVSVVQRDLRAAIMLAGIIISGFLYTEAILRAVITVTGENFATFQKVNKICNNNNSVLPALTQGIMPKANLFYLAWVTAYLAWSNSQWASAQNQNIYVWFGIALAWMIVMFNAYKQSGAKAIVDGGEIACPGLYPKGIMSLVGGIVFGLSYGAIIGAVSPTSLYFAPLSSSNMTCAEPRSKTYRCTIGNNNLS